PRRPRDARPDPRFVVRLLAQDAAGAGLLLVATAIALVWANSAWRHGYESAAHDVHGVVNDGLMVVFFLVAGAEIKRESGGWRDATLPAVAALGGMVVPALLYFAIAGDHGWGVPMATDIAFAVGVLALAGDRVPQALKVFLLTLAVVDDIGAIVIIAVFYSGSVDAAWLLAAAAALALAALARNRPFLLAAAGVALWFALHHAGVHPTLAGVAIGLLVPVERTPRVEQLFNPVATLFVLPAFALANAGVRFHADAFLSRTALATAVGLVAGKLLGVTGAVYAATRLRLASLPPGVRFRHIPTVGLAAGVGFTVSLFVANLAFADPSEARVGILLGSTIAALAGFISARF
ncbi:MAG TPA: Na+/H+ antiporter NhaA, partial [Acidimicrobiales bacterium]|nr:Na+/H+ antiporter NhaA [Acidimicrobiales bacterium]